MQIFPTNSEVTGYLNFVRKPKKQNQAFVFQARRSLFGNAGVNGGPQIPGASSLWTIVSMSPSAGPLSGFWFPRLHSVKGCPEETEESNKDMEPN